MRRTAGALSGVLLVMAGTALAACTSAQDVGATKGTAASSTPSGEPSASPSTSGPPTSAPPDQDLPFPHGAGPPGQGLARFYHQQVDWTSCDVSATCASIWVPLSYDDPDGPAITIAAKQREATDAEAKNGTLFINPGGPGASGIDFLGYAPIDATLAKDYNVVGFDPRGVGRSTPVDCITDAALDAFVAADPTPDTSAEIDDLQRQFQHFTDGCRRNSGQLLDHVSTIEAARDLDILRAVVHDSKLNYYGASYGTYLGATYAALFPKLVGRMVLDGAVDPEASPHDLAMGQTAGFQGAFTSYLRDCVASGNCPLGSTVEVAQQQVVDLLRGIDAHPLPTSSGRPLTEGLAMLGFAWPLYSTQSWPYETQALKQALQGQGDILLLLSDQYTHRGADGHYDGNALEAQQAVNCLDHPEHETVAEIRAGAGDFLAASPVFGPVATWFPYACSFWPVRPSLPQPDYSASGAPPIVVVGTTRDPATPYEDAVRLAKELDSGVLLTRDGDGHTALGSGNACIVQAVDKYLATGAPPAPGTSC